MDTLTKKSLNNLEILQDIKENDILISSNNELKLQGEYVQVENSIEIEYAIYFTFHHLLSLKNYELIYNKNIISKIDKGIDNVYKNDQLNNILSNNNHFHLIIRNIDKRFEEIKEYFYYESPFFTFFQYLHSITETFKENNIGFSHFCTP